MYVAPVLLVAAIVGTVTLVTHRSSRWARAALMAIGVLTVGILGSFVLTDPKTTVCTLTGGHMNRGEGSACIGEFWGPDTLP